MSSKKKTVAYILLTLALVFLPQLASAQTNTFPDSGKAGIGTMSPDRPLHVKDSGSYVGRFESTSAGSYFELIDTTSNSSNRGILGNYLGDFFLQKEGSIYGIDFYTGNTSKMKILNNGNVGIGTPNPTALLSVSKNQASGTEIRIDNDNAAGFAGLYMNGGFAGATGGFVQYNNVTGYRNLFVSTAGSDPLYLGTENSVRMTVLPGSGNVGIGITNPQNKLHVGGSVTVDGTINAKYQDLAEWVPSSEQLSPGTVVALDSTKSNQVVSSSTAYDTRVAGVISAQPGITLGEGGEGKVLVATTGRVRVKVDASRGAIQIGDLLVTSDVSGVAMKSEAVNLGGVQIHRPGTIIGKALEPLAKGTGEILVLLSLQ